MKKQKCPKCKSSDIELIFNKDNFNVLYELILNLNERISILELENQMKIK